MKKMRSFNLGLARDMMAVGCPLPSSRSEPLPHVHVELNSAIEAAAYVYASGTEYVFPVRITNNSYVDLQLERLLSPLPWSRANFRWLEDPRGIWPSPATYCF